MPIKNKRLIFVDLETSGLEPSQGHVILSMGAIVEKPGKKFEGMLDEFNVNIIPTANQWKLASSQALDVNGLTLEYLQKTGISLEDARKKFCEWLVANKVESGKVMYVGQNPNFDLRFLGYYMGDELEFINFPHAQDEVIDIRDLYSILTNRKAVPWLKNRNGHAISNALGVEEEPKPHIAIEGARVVKRNFDKMVELGVFEPFSGQ